jgi:hypothetical protein
MVIAQGIFTTVWEPSSVSFFPAHLIKPASQAALPAPFFSYPFLSLKPVNKPSHLPLPLIIDSLHLCIFVTDSTLTHQVSNKKARSNPPFFLAFQNHNKSNPLSIALYATSFIVLLVNLYNSAERRC